MRQVGKLLALAALLGEGWFSVFAYEYRGQFEVRGPSTALQSEGIKAGYRVMSVGVADSDRTPVGWVLDFRIRQEDAEYYRVLRNNAEKNGLAEYVRLSEIAEASPLSLEAVPGVIWNLPLSTHTLLFTMPLNDSDFDRWLVGLNNRMMSPSRLWVFDYNLEFSDSESYPTLIKRRGGEDPVRQAPLRQFMSRHVVGAERVLNSRLKAGGELSYVNRASYRPEVFGAGLSSRFALSDRVFAGGRASWLRESRRQQPQDDQGYFFVRSLRGELSTEPVYDLYLSASYTFIQEYEQQAAHGGTDQSLKSDQYGVALAYKTKESGFSIAAAFLRSELGELQRQYSGGLRWVL